MGRVFLGSSKGTKLDCLMPPSLAQLQRDKGGISLHRFLLLPLLLFLSSPNLLFSCPSNYPGAPQPALSLSKGLAFEIWDHHPVEELSS